MLSCIETHTVQLHTVQTAKMKFRMEYTALTLSQKPKEGEEGEGGEGLGHLTPLYKFICIRVPLASVL